MRRSRGRSGRDDTGILLLDFIRELAVVVVIALVLSVLVRTFLVQAFYVPSRSMEQTLLVDDRIIASKITSQVRGVHRGEVVVFHDPGEWLSDPIEPTGARATLRTLLVWIGLLPTRTGDDLVKRVIAVGGDRVVCCDDDGRITVNGHSLDESGYLPADQPTDQVRFDVTVPEGRLFMMGDNRGDSEDSRFHMDLNLGTVPVADVVGRVVVRIWPLSRIATLPVPSVFAGIPGPAAASGG